MTVSHRLAALGALGSITFLGSPAFADLPLTGNLEYVRPLDDQSDENGFGGGLRFGPRLNAKLLILAAEVGLDVHGFPGPIGPNVYRGVVGPRLGIGWLIRPSVSAHVGVGHTDWSVLTDSTHLTADLGLALDVPIVPEFEAGVHGMYVAMFNDTSRGAFEYLTLGVHVTVVFDGEERD
jgi:hypothetical protein